MKLLLIVYDSEYDARGNRPYILEKVGDSIICCRVSRTAAVVVTILHTHILLFITIEIAIVFFKMIITSMLSWYENRIIAFR